MATAVLIDGGFYLKRHRYLFGDTTPQRAADDIMGLSYGHLKNKSGNRRKLYRIFYYDCPPLTKYVQNPINQKGIKFSETPTAKFRLDLFEQLKKRRKVALRLGYLAENLGKWELDEAKLKKLISGQIKIHDLSASDIVYRAPQKAVDLRIGLDIASMAYKQQVNQIILVSGDSDFVPAAKLARREGIDFVLDPMGSNIRNDLFEHIDGLRTVLTKNSHETLSTRDEA